MFDRKPTHRPAVVVSHDIAAIGTAEDRIEIKATRVHGDVRAITNLIPHNFKSTGMKPEDAWTNFVAHFGMERALAKAFEEYCSEEARKNPHLCGAGTFLKLRLGELSGAVEAMLQRPGADLHTIAAEAGVLITTQLRAGATSLDAAGWLGKFAQHNPPISAELLGRMVDALLKD